MVKQIQLVSGMEFIRYPASTTLYLRGSGSDHPNDTEHHVMPATDELFIMQACLLVVDCSNCGQYCLFIRGAVLHYVCQSICPLLCLVLLAIGYRLIC